MWPPDRATLAILALPALGGIWALLRRTPTQEPPPRDAGGDFVVGAFAAFAFVMVWRGVAAGLADGLARHVVSNAGLLATGVALAIGARRIAPGVLGMTSRTLFAGVALGLLVYLALSLPILTLGDLNQEIVAAEDEGRNHATIDFVRALRGSPGAIALMFVLVGCVVPFFEEVLYRGWLQNGVRALLTDVTSPSAATVISVGVTAALFALVHPAFTLLPVFVLGLVIGGLYARTRNLWVVMAFHGAHNAWTLALALSM